MTCKFTLLVLVLCGCLLPGFAQAATLPPPVQVRAVLHDPMNHHAELYYMDRKGEMLPINFRPQALTKVMLMLPVKGMLVLHNTKIIDPDNPAASVVATAKLPEGIKQAMVVVMPAPADEEFAYRMVVIDDSKEAFPPGESMVLPLVSVKVAVQAGEHTLPVHPGKVTKVPFVTKVNKFHMAQTNFHYQHGGSWVTFAERQLQYVEACRRLFIIHATPGALQPTVTTIVDTNTGRALR